MTPVNALKDVMARFLGRFHRTVLAVSGGRIGNSGYGMPVVILHTIGRKSGKRRTTTLTSPIQEDGKVVLVASYGGDDRHPTWFLNLRDNPDVELTLGGTTRKMRAHEASAEEKAALWPRVVEVHKGYGNYQKRTERDIPLVILDPART